MEIQNTKRGRGREGGRGLEGAGAYCAKISSISRVYIHTYMHHIPLQTSLVEQARRLSRRVSRTTAWKQTSKLAMDVSKAAGKLTRVSSGVPHLNLFNDISDIYPLGSPTLFHKTLDVLLLLSCTYLVSVCVCVDFNTHTHTSPPVTAVHLLQ